VPMASRQLVLVSWQPQPLRVRLAPERCERCRLSPKRPRSRQLKACLHRSTPDDERKRMEELQHAGLSLRGWGMKLRWGPPSRSCAPGIPLLRQRRRMTPPAVRILSSGRWPPGWPAFRCWCAGLRPARCQALPIDREAVPVCRCRPGSPESPGARQMPCSGSRLSVQAGASSGKQGGQPGGDQAGKVRALKPGVSGTSRAPGPSGRQLDPWRVCGAPPCCSFPLTAATRKLRSGSGALSNSLRLAHPRTAREQRPGLAWRSWRRRASRPFPRGTGSHFKAW